MDADGNLVGINSQIRSETTVNEGVAFAIPSHLVLDLLPRLRETGVIEYSYLGLTTTEVTKQMARMLSLKSDHGVLIEEIAQNAPAAKAKLNKATAKQDFFGIDIGTGGDIITEINNQKVNTASELASMVTGFPPGKTIQLSIVKFNGDKKTVSLRLGSRSDITNNITSQVPANKK